MFSNVSLASWRDCDIAQCGAIGFAEKSAGVRMPALSDSPSNGMTSRSTQRGVGRSLTVTVQL
jgi:hypothetical protein